MTSFSLPIGPPGPVVRIEVGFSRGRKLALQRARRPVLSPIPIDALLDTGADVSMIEQGLLTPFVREGMLLRGFVQVNAPGLGGLAISPQFLVGLQIVHPSGTRNSNLGLDAIELVERPLGATDYQALIGRDILARCQFLYDGPAGTFSLTY
jgi:hypothetical protein